MIDDVIDPRETRPTIIRALEMARGQAGRAALEAQRRRAGVTARAGARLRTSTRAPAGHALGDQPLVVRPRLGLASPGHGRRSSTGSRSWEGMVQAHATSAAGGRGRPRGSVTAAVVPGGRRVVRFTMFVRDRRAVASPPSRRRSCDAGPMRPLAPRGTRGRRPDPALWTHRTSPRDPSEVGSRPSPARAARRVHVDASKMSPTARPAAPAVVGAGSRSRRGDRRPPAIGRTRS